MNKLIADARKTPFSHIIIITLFTIGLISIPLERVFALFIENEITSRLLGGFVVRFFVSLLALVFIFKYNFNKQFCTVNDKKTLLILIPALLIAINNAPIIGLITGDVYVTENALNIFLYVLYCVFVGFAEELSFRGLIFPLCMKITGDKKYGAFWGIALNAGIFALSHVVNVFNGVSIGAVALQVGYTFLIGALCAIIFAVTGNIFSAIIVHIVYDIGGLMCSNIAKGAQWDLLTIIITAVLGVVVCTFMVIKTFKLDGKKIKKQYFPDITIEE